MDYFDTYFDNDTPVPPKIGKLNCIKYRIKIKKNLFKFLILDLLLVPDFPGIGNADWGLSSLNEDTILFIETENSRKDKEKVALAVANVIAHYVS